MESLITRLKGVVNNDNLKELGTIYGTSGSNPNNGYVTIFATEANKVKLTILTDGVTITNANGSASVINGKQVMLGDSTDGFFVSPAGSNFKYKIENKYKCKTLGTMVNIDGVYLDISDYAYCINLGKIAIQSNIDGKFYGDISELYTCAELTHLSATYAQQKLYGTIDGFTALSKLNVIELDNDYVEGDIQNLGNMVINETTNISINNTQIYGTVESLIKRFRERGFSTGSIIFYAAGSKVTFDNSAIIYDPNNTLSWTADTISYHGKTITR